MWTKRAVVALWIAALAGVVLLLVGASQTLLGSAPDVPAVPFVRSAEAIPFSTAVGGALATAVFGLILLVGHLRRRW